MFTILLDPERSIYESVKVINSTNHIIKYVWHCIKNLHLNKVWQNEQEFNKI